VARTTIFVPMDSAPTKWVHANVKCASVTASLPKPSSKQFSTIHLPMEMVPNTVLDQAMLVANRLTDNAAKAVRTTFSGIMPITTNAARMDPSDSMALVKLKMKKHFNNEKL